MSYSLLRPSDTCKHFLKMRNSLAAKAMDEFVASDDFQAVIVQVKGRLFSQADPSGSHSNTANADGTLLLLLMKLCGRDLEVGEGPGQWCTLFDAQTIRIANKLESIQKCYQYGPCTLEPML